MPTRIHADRNKPVASGNAGTAIKSPSNNASTVETCNDATHWDVSICENNQGGGPSDAVPGEAGKGIDEGQEEQNRVEEEVPEHLKM